MKYLIICILFLMFFSCNKNNSDILPDYDYFDLSNYFPLQIGNSWIYEMENIGEWAILQRTIVDTIRNNERQLLYKAKWGILNYPPDSYLFEYYYWNNSGLNKYSCGIEDTCKNTTGEILPPYLELIIKSPVYEGEKWNRGPEWLTSERLVEFSILDSLVIYNKVSSTICDTIFYNVAVISYTNTTSNETVNTYEYYAPNFGLINYYTISETDTVYQLRLLDYKIE